MSVLVYIENDNNEIKKSSNEAIAYAGALASQLGTEAIGVGFNLPDDQLALAGKYGVQKVLGIAAAEINENAPQAIASSLAALAEELGASIVVLSNSSVGESASSRLAVKLKAGIATNVIGLPDTSSGFKVKRGIYTGKAFCTTNISTDKKVLTVKKNGYDFEEAEGAASVESKSLSVNESDLAVQVTATKKQEGDILLPEADLVVSAGRGLKGPENWGMIDELAKLLGAGTACSKPVSDADWRPHHEHVGQTGIKISPNLYIAIGISGAIQHLAGVSSSKVIVVINIDSEAPFFKAADYGIVGDAFEVVPKLIEALK